MIKESSLYKRIQSFLPIFIIIFFFVNSFISAGIVSKTYDEDTHLGFGLNLLQGNAERPWESVMPVSAWNAAPSFILKAYPGVLFNNCLSTLLAARAMTILFSCGVAYLVFHFSRLLYGFVPAMFSLVFFVFDPNILAHSQLVTTDIFATGALLLVVFLLWRYVRNRNWGNRILLAMGLGFALVTKYTAMSFVPLIFSILFLYDVMKTLREEQHNGKYIWLMREYVKLIVLTTVISVIILNIAYLAHRSFVPFGDYAFRSEVFSKMQTQFPFLDKIPVPLPYPHLQGFDWILAYEQTGEGHGNHYFLGQLRRGEGFVGYYIIAFLLKEPIATQLIILLAFGMFVINAVRYSHFWQREFFLFIPIAFYTLYFNFFYNSQIGIRYYLVVFPLLHIFAGSLFSDWQFFSLWKKRLSNIAVLYLVASTFSYFPYYLPYFNEIVWNRAYAYKYLADSNLDWGQGSQAMAEYLMNNPDVSYPTRYVRPGRFIVSINDLVGIKDPEVYAWLRENFEPIGHVAYSNLLFEISPDEKRELCLNSSYCSGK